MQNSFSYERFRTQTRFETEAEENSEMAYLAKTKLLGNLTSSLEKLLAFNHFFDT